MSEQNDQRFRGAIGLPPKNGLRSDPNYQMGAQMGFRDPETGRQIFAPKSPEQRQSSQTGMGLLGWIILIGLASVFIWIGGNPPSLGR